jgi:peptidoglycan/LPS O-acetylase OafA/YrhL
MFAALMVPGVLVVLAVSYAFFRVFEEPFMRQAGAAGWARSAADASAHRKSVASVPSTPVL